MAESKKREFSRAIAQKRCLEAIDRAILINEGKAERPFLYTVNELVVFGSLVSSEKSKVHDVDLFVTWKQKLDFQDDYKARTRLGRTTPENTRRILSGTTGIRFSLSHRLMR